MTLNLLIIKYLHLLCHTISKQNRQLAIKLLYNQIQCENTNTEIHIQIWEHNAQKKGKRNNMYTDIAQWWLS